MTKRVVFLTGASSGIGAGVAEVYGKRGARLALMARRADALEDLADRVRSLGGEALVLPGDVTDGDRVHDAVQQVLGRWGPVDVAFANAGIGGPIAASRFAPETRAAVQQVMRVNVEGAINLYCSVLPSMLQRGRGHLVGTSSLAAWRGLPASAPYSASKAALSTLLESMRLDLQGTGVKVTAVHPGFVRTPLTDTNRFPMPFLMELDRASELIVRRLERAPRSVAFPWPIVAAMGLASLVPGPLYDWIMGGRVEAIEG